LEQTATQVPTPWGFGFEFYLLDEDGLVDSPQLQGSFDSETLRLADQSIPVERILAVGGAEEDTLLVVLDDQGREATIQISVSAEVRHQLVLGVRRISAGDAYREVVCPYCESVIPIYGLAETRQVYCCYCDTIATLAVKPPRGEHRLRLCDQCCYYACPQNFTIFYFWFLLIVWGWDFDRIRVCHSCMRLEAWRMLWKNAIFVIGLPFALFQLVRAYRGGRLSAPDYPGLDDANAAAKRGEWDVASSGYEAILSTLPAAAGVRYNQAMCFVLAGESGNAAPLLEAALADCSNYEPAASVLLRVYQRLGRDEELSNLKIQWPDLPDSE